MMRGNEIRRRFLTFFERKGHLHVESFPLIPKDDPSLLLIGAGMAPLKPYFTGKVTPPCSRLTTCQKCMRTGDLENVGRTARHHTFFEMLGNFSFGDYFKKEAIHWAWEFLTEELHLEPERLYVTIHPEDEEAYTIWHDEVGVPKDHIYKLEDNFWEIGEGPCGPCSEIFYDQGEAFGTDPENQMGGEGDRFLEIWNLVFSQYNRTADGQYEPLAHKNIDTGAGLERLAAVLQHKKNNFETDLIYPLIEQAAHLAGVHYGDNEATDVSLKVIADHARATTALIGDGVLPSNEGRGYVLRRIIRRAVRKAKMIGIKGPFMAQMVDTVIDLLGDGITDLPSKREFIKVNAATEEERFQRTLDQGSLLLQERLETLTAEKTTTLSGEDVFKLYDTYGFPWELTEEIAAEAGILIDRDGFVAAMEAQRQRARDAREKQDAKVVTPDTTGLKGAGRVYDETVSETEVIMLGRDGKEVDAAEDGTDVVVILRVNPFHAEGGGQLGDVGILTAPGGKVRVTDTKCNPDGTIYLTGEVEEGLIKKGDTVLAQPDTERRHDMARNHTGTHLLQAALQHVLGAHVTQAGSVVMPDRLRFDFTHAQPLTDDQISQVERYVNETIWQGIPTLIEEMPIARAKEMGAMALFGEKYGDVVRVVQVPRVSIELCGGSHVANTGEIGLFRIISESGIGSGIRRIEAVTGRGAYELVKKEAAKLERASVLLKATPATLLDRLGHVLTDKKALEKELDTLHRDQSKQQISKLAESALQIGDLTVVSGQVDATDMNELRQIGDLLKTRPEVDVVLLGAVHEGKVFLLAAASKKAITAGVHAGQVVKAAAQTCGGGGGGRPDMAQAGGKQPKRLKDALVAGIETVRATLF